MTQKKIRINLEDSEGAKYKFDIEGNVTREKVLKLFELMDIMNLEDDQKTPELETLGGKIWYIIENYFPASRKGRRSRSMIQKHVPVSRVPNMSSEDSVKHVLKLITKKPMTSRDIEVTFGGRSREHVSRLMKKLFDDGLVERNTTNRPYTYSITDSGKNHIGEENLVYAVSQ